MIGKISIGEYLVEMALEERLKISQKAVQEHLEDWRLSIHEYLSNNIKTYRKDKEISPMLNRYKDITETQYLLECMEVEEFANYVINNKNVVDNAILALLKDLWGEE